MEEELGPFGQLPFLRTYTLTMPCFSLPSGVNRSEVTGQLTEAGHTPTSRFPGLAGQVVRKASPKSSEGLNSVIHGVQAYTHPDGSIFIFKHIGDEFPTYGQVHAADTPASFLNGHVPVPMKGEPNHYTDATPQPVLVIQANIVEGGLLICFAEMHIHGCKRARPSHPSLCKGMQRRGFQSF